MRKERIHHVDAAKGDQHIAFSHAQHALAQIAAGHYRIADPIQSDVAPGHVRITFDRIETDPSAPAHDPVAL